MKLSRNIFTKSILTILIVAICFGTIQVPRAEAYDTQQRQSDIDYISKHIGTTNPDDLGTSVTSAKAKYLKLRTSFNVVLTAKTKLDKSNASQADKNAMNAVFTNIKAEMDGVYKAYMLILGYDRDGKKMLTDLKEGSILVKGCTTFNGIFGEKTDKYGEPMSFCGKEFNDDYRYKAFNQNHDYIAPRDFYGYQVQAQEILNRNPDVVVSNDDVTKAEAKAKREVPQAALESCVYSVGINIGTCLTMAVGWVIYMIVTMLYWLVEFGGFLLNFAIKYSVIDLKTNLDGISSIGSLWVMARDVANLGFIFLLLYVAVATILDLGVNWKQTLRKIIIAAILINFSLFITKLILDLSNIVTLAFYNQIGAQTGISNVFMNMLGLSTLQEVSSETVNAWSQSWSTLAAYGLGSIVILFTVAFSFITAAWLFILRYAIIILLLIASPLAFASQAFPNLNNQFKKWWTALMSQALFPVIYMVFLWITLRVGTELLGTMAEDGERRSIAETFVLDGTDANSFAPFMKFLIIMIILNAGLMLAKSQAEKVGKDAGKLMKMGTGYIEGYRNRIKNSAIGVAQRNLVNRPLKNIRSGYNNTIATRGKNLVDGAKFIAKNPGKVALGVAASPAIAAYRGVKYAGKAAAIGLDRTINDTLKTGENLKAKGTENLAEYDKYTKGRKRDLNNTEQAYEDNQTFNSALKKEFKDLKEADRDLIIALDKVAGRISVKELEEKGYDDILKNPALLAMLDVNKFKSVLESKELDLNDDQKKALRDKRKLAQTEWATHPTFGRLTNKQQEDMFAAPADKKPKYGSFTEKVGKMKSPDVAELSPEVLTTMAENSLLNRSDFDQIISKGTLTRPEKDKIREIVSKKYSGDGTPANPGMRTEIEAAVDRAVREHEARTGKPVTAKQRKSIRISDRHVVGATQAEKEATAILYQRVREQNDILFNSEKGLNF
jgi:hypothetical protein